MRNETEAYRVESQGDNKNAGCFDSPTVVRKTRLEQLEDERDYFISEITRVQKKINFLKADPSFRATLTKFSEIDD